MTTKRTEDLLAIAHVEKDEDGTNVEPEQQPAQQRGVLPISVNLGVADINAEAEGRKANGPIITQRNLQHGIDASFTRETSAGQVANEIRRRCVNCKHFDLDKLQSSPKIEQARVEITQTLISLGYTSDLIKAAEMATRVGFCKQRTVMACPDGCCDQFVEARFTPEAKASRSKFDQIMAAAQGRIGLFKRKIIIGGK